MERSGFGSANEKVERAGREGKKLFTGCSRVVRMGKRKFVPNENETVDKCPHVENLQDMPTISTHLPVPVYKRLRSRLGRKRSASAFIRMAVEKELSDERSRQPTAPVLRIASRIDEMLEDEMDIRRADEVMARVRSGKEKIYSREEALTMLGL